jgi:hypothetical protein
MEPKKVAELEPVKETVVVGEPAERLSDADGGEINYSIR